MRTVAVCCIEFFHLVPKVLERLRLTSINHEVLNLECVAVWLLQLMACIVQADATLAETGRDRAHLCGELPRRAQVPPTIYIGTRRDKRRPQKPTPTMQVYFKGGIVAARGGGVTGVAIDPGAESSNDDDDATDTRRASSRSPSVQPSLFPPPAPPLPPPPTDGGGRGGDAPRRSGGAGADAEKLGADRRRLPDGYHSRSARAPPGVVAPEDARDERLARLGRSLPPSPPPPQ